MRTTKLKTKVAVSNLNVCKHKRSVSHVFRVRERLGEEGNKYAVTQ